MPVSNTYAEPVAKLYLLYKSKRTRNVPVTGKSDVVMVVVNDVEPIDSYTDVIGISK